MNNLYFASPAFGGIAMTQGKEKYPVRFSKFDVYKKAAVVFQGFQ